MVLKLRPKKKILCSDVTSSQTLPYGSYTDATGTEIDYRPPPGTNRVEYSLTFTYDHHSSIYALLLMLFV